MRWWIYLHLSRVAFWAMFFLADRGLFLSRTISDFVEHQLAILLRPAIACLLFCPLAVLILTIKRRGRSVPVGYGWITEAVLILGHILVLQPTVM